MKAVPMLAVLLAATFAMAAAPHVSDGRLVDEHGMTLYLFDGKGAPDADRAKATAKETSPQQPECHRACEKLRNALTGRFKRHEDRDRADHEK